MKITFTHALIYFLRKCFRMVVFYFVLTVPDINLVVIANDLTGEAMIQV